MNFPEKRFFTGIRDREAENLIRGKLSRLAEELRLQAPPELAAVFLGGGYGRGEGGVFRSSGGECALYNDLDLFTVVHPVSRARRKQIDVILAQIGEKWTGELGIEVEFGRAMTISAMKKQEKTLMFQELKHGHFCIYGDESLLDSLGKIPPAELSSLEAIRLLTNRGMGLALAGASLNSPGYDPGFFIRNLNKAILGAGDSMLIRAGQYDWNGAARVKAFRRLSGTYAAEYEQAFHWKLEPVHRFPAGKEDPRIWWEEVRDFWLFSACRTVGADPLRHQNFAAVLHRFCRRKQFVSWKNALRWLVKSVSPKPWPMFFDAPAAKILAALYQILSMGSLPDEKLLLRSDLYRNWLVFK